jgi:hypothetical protein
MVAGWRGRAKDGSMHGSPAGAGRHRARTRARGKSQLQKQQDQPGAFHQINRFHFFCGTSRSFASKNSRIDRCCIDAVLQPSPRRRAAEPQPTYRTQICTDKRGFWNRLRNGARPFARQNPSINADPGMQGECIGQPHGVRMLLAVNSRNGCSRTRARNQIHERG